MVRWSPAAERIFGWTEQEVLGQPLPLVPPGFEEEFGTRLALTLAGKSETGYETQRLRRDGQLDPGQPLDGAVARCQRRDHRRARPF